MSDFDAYTAGRNNSWHPDMGGSAWKNGREAKDRETSPTPFPSSPPSPSYSSPSYTPSYTSPSYGSSSSYGFSGSSISAADAEALGELVGWGLKWGSIIGIPAFTIYEAFKHFPNETTFVGAAGALTGAVVASDWIRDSRTRQVVAGLTAFAGTGLSIWAMRANHMTEGVVPHFLSQTVTHNPQATLTAGIALGFGLFGKSIKNNIGTIAAIPAALTLFAGGIDGLYDGLAHNETNPFSAGGKAFIDTAGITSAISKWYVGSKIVGPIVSLPYEASGFIGGFLGTTAVDAGRYVIVPTLKFIGHEIAKHIPPAENPTANSATPLNVSPQAPSIEPAVATPASLSSATETAPIPTQSVEAAQDPNTNEKPLDERAELPATIIRSRVGAGAEWVATLTKPVTFFPYSGDEKFISTHLAPVTIEDTPRQLDANSKATVMSFNNGFCELAITDQPSGRIIYGAAPIKYKDALAEDEGNNNEAEINSASQLVRPATAAQQRVPSGATP